MLNSVEYEKSFIISGPDHSCLLALAAILFREQKVFSNFAREQLRKTHFEIWPAFKVIIRLNVLPFQALIAMLFF